MSTPVKDYSGPEYDIVREHHARPYALHYEQYDARRAKNTPPTQGALAGTNALGSLSDTVVTR